MLLRNGITAYNKSSSTTFGKPSNDSYNCKYDDEISSSFTYSSITLSWSGCIDINNVYQGSLVGRIICSSSTVAVQPNDYKLDDKIVNLVSVSSCQYLRPKQSLDERPYIEYTQNLRNVGENAVTVNKIGLYLCSSSDDSFNSSTGAGPKVGEFDSAAAMVIAQNLDSPVIVQAGETKAFLIRLYMTD